MIYRIFIRLLLAGLVCLAWPMQVSAHFQMLYVQQSALDRGGVTRIAMVFTHPFNAGSTMDMGQPRSFYMVHQRGAEGAAEKTELMEYLQSVTWNSLNDTGKAFVADLPSLLMRSLGDYSFVLVPEPYYEAEEDRYIQQMTRMVMNIGGIPGNWDQSSGLVTEILPLDKPYANWTGGIFRGVVMSGGKPVAGAELEIEYINHTPDMEGLRFNTEAEITAPHPSLQTMSIRADGNGEFAIGLPRAGWWGICALGSGPETEFNGKPLSQDAVLWIQVTELD